MIDVVFVAELYEHRSVIKDAIDKTKMRPGPKIEHFHIIAMLFKNTVGLQSKSKFLPSCKLRLYAQHCLHYTKHSILCVAMSRFQRSQLPSI